MMSATAPMNFLILLLVQAIAGKCTTPNNVEGDCVSLYKCPVLLNALATNPSASKEFVKLSNCGGTSEEPLVCCGSFSSLNASENNAPSKGETVYSKHLLAERRYCGYQHSDDYYHPENSTGLDEFPWLALLLFKDLNNNTAVPNIRCSGSLIGQKYVLTAAHCVTSTRYNLTAVRFGEYNVDKSKDCIEGYLEECSDPTEDFGVEKVISHPGYTNFPIFNDIALIRLNKRVVYSDYIRPICLPVPETKRAEPGDVLTTSGWGRTADGTLAKIKKRVSIRLITNTLCEVKYRPNQHPIKQGHFCTVGVNDTDIFCTGDNGAPVMFSDRHQWHQEGITSFGKVPCDPEFPNVNTKVVNYLNWIEENILP